MSRCFEWPLMAKETQRLEVGRAGFLVENSNCFDQTWNLH